jgi:hypothetical protein
MVALGDSRFYARNNRGKYPLDIGEIRSAFSSSENLVERITRFRNERIARIIAGETPVLLSPDPKRILHILPVTAFDPNSRRDVTAIVRKQINNLFINDQEEYWWHWQSRYNFDGYLLYREPYRTDQQSSNITTDRYLQVFRNGALEEVSNLDYEEINGIKAIMSNSCEGELILEALPRYLKVEQALAIDTPLVIAVTLIGVEGFAISYYRRGHSYPVRIKTNSIIDREVLVLPDALLEDYYSDPSNALRPIIDIIWQCVGESNSPNFDVNGRWSLHADGSRNS